MNIKLTLSLNKEVIERAKQFAKSNNRTLSNLVETQLRAVTKQVDKNEIHPEIKKLMGKIQVGAGFNHKEEMKKIMAKKKKYD
ncbi:MAG: DUF6364 family protein [Ferruginibacter sp.]